MTTCVTRLVKRETCAGVYSAGKRRAVLILLHPPGSMIGFRLKGTRHTFYLDVEACYRRAVRQEQDRQKQERAAARKGKRK